MKPESELLFHIQGLVAVFQHCSTTTVTTIVQPHWKPPSPKQNTPKIQARILQYRSNRDNKDYSYE